MSKLQTLLASRKFWAATIGLGLIIIKAYRPDFPITSDQMNAVVVVLVGYILGTAVEDAKAPLPPGGSATGNPPPAG